MYTDQGPADEDAIIRGLIGFPTHNVASLESAIQAIYDPANARFRQYLTPQQWIDRYAPPQADLDVVIAWLRQHHLEVPRVASNRLLIQYRGRVGDFNEAFGTEIHVLERRSPQGGNAPFDVFGTIGTLSIPQFISDRITTVLTADLEVDTSPLPVEVAPAQETLPPNVGDAFTPEQIARAYNVDALYSRGFRGQGVRLGVIIGAAIRFKDARAFWSTFGVPRPDPRVVQTMEPPSTRYREGNYDVEWAGAMAPEADLVIYMAPDARNTSMVYTFNEAVARGGVDILTDSFAHREDSEPHAIHRAYNASARMAAALGITIVAASGDTAQVDVPSASPWVTAVGGTTLVAHADGSFGEYAWEQSGSGGAVSFARPWWQTDADPSSTQRACVDVSLNAGNSYWAEFWGVIHSSSGTSFAAPTFAGILATVYSARAADGKPPPGWLNSQLYGVPDVRASFRDITAGNGWFFPAGPGWDYPTGLGAPDAVRLYETLP